MSSQPTNLNSRMSRGMLIKTGHAEERDYSRMFTGILFGVFVIMLLVALLSGTKVYGTIQDATDATNDQRMALSLIANNVRANDAADSVITGNGPEGPALVLREISVAGKFETRLYLYQGHIMQEYTLADVPYNPEKATPLVASDTFSFECKDGLLTVTCDQGSTSIALRSAKGGA